MKIKHCLASILIMVGASSPALSQPIELLHYWISPGENAAVETIGKAVERQGFEWANSGSSDYLTMRRDAISRATTGVSPTAILMQGGEDLRHTAKLGIMHPLSQQAMQGDWSEVLHPVALDAVTVDGQVIAIPFTIHNENWVWYDANIYRQLGLSLPNSWQEFVEQAPAIEQAGFVPLSVGEADWVIRILFTSIVAGVGGKPLHEALYVDAEPSVVDNPKMQEAIEVFAALRAHGPKPGDAKTWLDAINLVIEGKAAANVMGDWAKGEFISHAKMPEVDYFCRPSPGAQDLFIAGVDAFALPISAKGPLTVEQSVFLEIAMNPEVQTEFALLKGSIPAINLAHPENLDFCGKLSFPMLQSEASTVIISRETTPEKTHLAIQNALGDFWRNSTQEPDTLKASLREILTP
ncbi:MAG: carbohydrate ABC transporter substrate-binding protein [Gammaproteobacteria bacterium]|nr:carbohydrate ABC transporter substrate-binding protein [Gammaproteobacteria bacterium]